MKSVALMIWVMTFAQCQLLHNKWTIGNVPQNNTQGNSTQSSVNSTDHNQTGQVDIPFIVPPKPDSLEILHQLNWGVTSGPLHHKLGHYNQQFNLELYPNNYYSEKLQIKIDLKTGISPHKPFYQDTALVKTTLMSQGTNLSNSESATYQVQIDEHRLTVSSASVSLEVTISPEVISQWVLVWFMVLGYTKLLLIYLYWLRIKVEANTYAPLYMFFSVYLECLCQQMASVKLNTDSYIFPMLAWTKIILAFTIFFKSLDKYRLTSCELMLVYFFIFMADDLLSQHLLILIYVMMPLWQARHSYLNALRPKLCPTLAVYVINLIIICYVKGCPACPLRYQIELSVCLWIAIIGAAVLGIMLAQCRYGPYLCLRGIVLRNEYKYLQRISLSQREETCAVCMHPIGETQFLSSWQEEDGQLIGEVMVTPCNHYYHPDCLREWMQHNPKCPMDNQPLPLCHQFD